jgi:heterodisulfide reductase subunit A
MGVEFIKGKVASINEDEALNPVLRVELIEDGSQVVERTHDLVVLSVGMIPAYDPRVVYQVQIADDGFVATPASNFAPCETDRPGIFVTGTAAGPMDIVDSIVMAGAAAATAAGYIETHANGQTETESIDERRELIHA